MFFYGRLFVFIILPFFQALESTCWKNPNHHSRHADEDCWSFWFSIESCEPYSSVSFATQSLWSSICWGSATSLQRLLMIQLFENSSFCVLTITFREQVSGQSQQSQVFRMENIKCTWTICMNHCIRMESLNKHSKWSTICMYLCFKRNLN